MQTTCDEERNLKSIKWFLIVSFFTFISLSLFPITTSADSNGVPFTVEPVLPKSQIADVNSYISVHSDKDSLNEDFEFIITNQSDDEQEIEISIVDAYTSPNGVIQYVKDESENSTITNSAYKLSNYLKGKDDTVLLKAGETKTVSTSFDANDMEGVLLGGVSFSAVEEGEEQEEGESSFQINNEINMVVGVMVTFNTNKDVEFTIEEPFLDPMPSYFAIRLPITLDSPLLVQDTEIDYQVMYKDEVLFDSQKEFSFAPFTQTKVSIPFEGEEIKENEDYTIKGELVYENRKGNKVTKEFEETFQYEKETKGSEVSKILNVPLEKGDFPLWVLTLIAIPVVLFIGFIIYKRKK